MKEKLEKGPKPVKDKEVNVGPWWVTERRKQSITALNSTS